MFKFQIYKATIEVREQIQFCENTTWRCQQIFKQTERILLTSNGRKYIVFTEYYLRKRNAYHNCEDFFWVEQCKNTPENSGED